MLSFLFGSSVATTASNATIHSTPMTVISKSWSISRPSTMSLFQGVPWIDWVQAKKEHIPIYLFTHFDRPEIQTESQRISNSFARSLFYTHGLLLFDRTSIEKPIPTLNVSRWFEKKLNPSTNFTTSYRYIKSSDNKWTQHWNTKKYPLSSVSWAIPDHWTNYHIAQFLASLKLHETHHQPLNYTIGPQLEVVLSLRGMHVQPGFCPWAKDPLKKYFMVIDTGTSKVSGVVQPELVTMKDVAYILFDSTGKTLVEQTMKCSLTNPEDSYLFFLHMALLLRDYEAEIVAYNGAFDSVVLSRWPFNPVVEQLLSVWNHDVMYMVMKHFDQSKACSLSTAYQKIMGSDASWKWHVSLNDCRGTKELFLRLYK